MKQLLLILLLSSFVLSSCSSDEIPKDASTGDTWESSIDGMTMVFIPSGEFEMGSSDEEIAFALEKCNEEMRLLHPGEGDCLPEWFDVQQPIHTVYLDAYWIDSTEVTNALFAKFVEENKYQTDAEKLGYSSFVFSEETEKSEKVYGADWQHPHGPKSNIHGLENHPVVNVSWNDAVTYCTWAGKRLPTEAEWEKSAGWDLEKGQNYWYPWGNHDLAGNLLNYSDRNLDVQWADTTQDDGYKFTAPVGSYPDGASPYGTLDMAGNVMEWVWDYYAGEYYDESEYESPQGPSSGTYRVLRGGSWGHDSRVTRSSDRSQFPYPSYALNWAGFRCAISQ